MAKYRFVGGKVTLVEGAEPPDRPIGAPSLQFFKEGWYEHIAENPIYVSSMSQLKRECEKHGVTSKYERDTGTFKRSGRWV